MIEAMGATHLDQPHKLQNILNTLDDVRRVEVSEMLNRPTESELKCVEYIKSEYDIVLQNRVHSYTPYVAEVKIDGFSYLCEDGEMISKSLSTAKGNEGKPVIKTGHVPHIHEIMKKVCSKFDADFHGELFMVDGTSDDVTSIMGCTEDKAVARQYDHKHRLHYMLIDIRRFMGCSVVNEPYYVRRALLEYVHSIASVIWYRDMQYIKLSSVSLDPRKLFKYIVSNGGEGIVLKNTRGLYVPGKKPADNWIKVKKEITLDAFIMGYNDGGSGKNKNLFKSLAVGMYIDNKETYVGDVHSGISDDLRKDMHNNRTSYLNRVIELSAMDYNKKDNSISFRHARLERFRDDKTIMQCTLDGVKLRTEI